MNILEYDKLKQNPNLYVEMKSVNGLSGANTEDALGFFNFYVKSKWSSVADRFNDCFHTFCTVLNIWGIKVRKCNSSCLLDVDWMLSLQFDAFLS